jgi:hypothetical protein
MGEPVPGDIADPIRLSTTNITLSANQVGVKGDFLVPDGATGNWRVAVVADSPITGPFVQAQEDFNTTGVAAGTVTLAAWDYQSRIYANIEAGVIPVGDVSLSITGDTPQVHEFIDPAAGDDAVGKYVKMSGDNPIQTSVAGVAVIDLGAQGRGSN